MLGICNGFQALVKLGLVPFGDIRADGCRLRHPHLQQHRPPPEHASSRTRVASQRVPLDEPHAKWGRSHTVPISHGEGRFVAPPALLDSMIANGQIATQYVDAAAAAFRGHRR